MPATCSYFQRGFCRFGDRCRNSHDLTTSLPRAASSSNNIQNDGATSSSNVNCDITTTSYQNEPLGFRVNRDLKIQKNRFTVTLNPITEEKINGTPKEVITALMAKLNMAEKEISSLKTKLQNMCGLDNLPCTEHNDFKLNEQYFHCMVCTQLMIKPVVLNCSHMFCEVCVETWSSVKPLCPVCRVFIEKKSYCLDLDEYLKKMIELGPADVRDEYKKEEAKRMLEGPRRIVRNRDDDYDDHVPAVLYLDNIPEIGEYDSDDELDDFPNPVYQDFSRSPMDWGYTQRNSVQYSPGGFDDVFRRV